MVSDCDNSNEKGTASPVQGVSRQGAALSELSASLEKLVVQTMESLTARGIDVYELAPLIKLRDAVRALDACGSEGQTAGSTLAGAGPHASGADRKAHYDRDGRRGQFRASEELMARASAIIDLLVHAGQSPEHAAQMITRQLLAMDIHLPETGGDSRAWKRLFNWRSNLIHYKRAGRAWDEYCAFKEKLAHIPPEERLRRAVGERLWDRRRDHMADQETA